MIIIRLGHKSLYGSSNLPGSNVGHAIRNPIWSCSGWSLPCNQLLPVVRCALTAPFQPYLCSRTSHRRSSLCCTCRRFTPPRRYLAPCPVEPGLSSPFSTSTKSDDCLGISGADNTTVFPELHPVYACCIRYSRGETLTACKKKWLNELCSLNPNSWLICKIVRFENCK